MDVDQQVTGKPDVADVDRIDLKTRESIATLSDSPNAFDVVIPVAAWEAMQQHSRVRLDVEVGGVLIGRTVAAPDAKPYLLIDAGIPALAAESRETNITFTAEAWTKIHEIIDRDHAGAAIVGWYHTHPSFGIFLSEMDLFIQRHFFDLPHQVAIVIDPVAKSHGCFIWRAGAPTLGPLLIEGVAESALAPASPAAIARSSPAPVERVAPRAAPRASRDWRKTASAWGSRTSAAIDPLTRLDLSQWIALLALIVISFVLFGALVVLWLEEPAWTEPNASSTPTTLRSEAGR